MKDLDKIKEKEKGDEFKGMLAIGMIFLIALGVIVYILINLTNQYFDLRTKLEDSKDSGRVMTTSPEEGSSYEYKMDKTEIKVAEIKKEIEKESRIDFDEKPSAEVAADNGSQKQTEQKKPAKLIASKKVKATPVIDIKPEPKKKIVKKPTKQKQKPVQKVTKKKEKPAPQSKKKEKTVKPAKPSTKFRYVVQLMAFKNKKDAEAKVKQYQNKFDGLYIVKVDLGKKGTWYRVRCCGSDGYSSAKKRVEEIKKATGLKPIVVKSVRK